MAVVQSLFSSKARDYSSQSIKVFKKWEKIREEEEKNWVPAENEVNSEDSKTFSTKKFPGAKNCVWERGEEGI